MKANKTRALLPLIIFFIIINTIAILNPPFFERIKMDNEVLIVGNLVVFVTTLLSYMLALRGLKSPNPHRFVRAVYASIMIKLFICMIAALVYIMMTQKNLNKAALFTSMGLYLVYTFIEVRTLTRVLKNA